MGFSFATIAKDIESGLDVAANIAQSVAALKAVGASKESTLQKVVTITEMAATVAQGVPIPQVQAVSTLVLGIVEDVFGTPGETTTTTATKTTTDPPPPPPSL